jgi:molecular chaperone GrpE
MSNRPGKPDKKHLPKLPPPEPVDPWAAAGEEASGGSLPPSPELEEALREAAAAIPDRGARKPAPAPEAEAPETAAATDRIEDLSAELVETRDRLIRLQADFENYRRRAQREREEAIRYGSQNLFKDLLTTVDNLERAIDHARMGGGADLENLLQGVELVQKGLVGLMSTHGVEEIDALGRPFDPAVHEAMAQAPDASQAPNTVLEVLQKGYKLRDRLLRPARVIISRAAEATDEGSEGQATD